METYKKPMDFVFYGSLGILIIALGSILIKVFHDVYKDWHNELLMK